MIFRSHLSIVVAGAGMLALLFGEELSAQVETANFSPEQIEFFEKNVRPVLSEHCFKCHGKDHPEGELRLDSRARAIRGGNTGPAIVPGKTDEGELLLAITYDPDGYQMPPAGKLPEKNISDLKKWIEMGAPWPEEETAPETDRIPKNIDSAELARRAKHWSFRPLVRHPLPAVRNNDWVRSPVDRFILSKLEINGFSPATEADRRTWLRRAFFDTIGLPPTPEELEEFLSDDLPGAEERVIDSLLSNPHFGERWGRHWLDLTRYAESRGHEFDYDVANPWHYRDYVIRALNDDVPYDQFVVEHVAGDLLKLEVRDERSEGNPSANYPLRLHPLTGANESIVATGWWYLGEWVHSPVDIRQDEADRFDNMIDVYSKTFLGLTVACARCHDHKFDPITQQDFYALQGYLQSSTYRQARFESMEHNKRIAKEIREIMQRVVPDAMQDFSRTVQPVISELDDYLLAARELLQQSEELRQKNPDIIFEDFETGTYDNWTVEGDAFGNSPQTLETIASYQGKINAVGNYFVNSHQRRDGGSGDAAIGSMTSKPFAIEHGYIRFWVGGGNHPDQTAVLLMVNNKPVRKATGPDSNQMQPVEWDVRDLQGQEAFIRVVDNVKGGWGNIGFDHIVFSDGDMAQQISEHDFAAAFRERIADQAARLSLDPEILGRWTAHLLNAFHDENDPFYPWAVLAKGSEEQIAGLCRSTENSQQDAETFLSSGTVAAENGWIDAQQFTVVEAGTAFKASGMEAMDRASVLLTSHPSWPIDSVIPVAEIRTNPRSPNLIVSAGTLHEPGALESWTPHCIAHTPTFEVPEGKISLLVYGGVNAYFAVDSHVLIRGPLHGVLTREIPFEPAWRWIDIDLSRYATHRVHIEFYSRPGEACRIRGVALGNRIEEIKSRKTPKNIGRTIQQRVLNRPFGESVDWQDLQTLAGSYLKEFLSASSSVPWNSPSSVASESCTPEALQWILEHPNLFQSKAGEDLVGSNKEVANAISRVQQLSAEFKEESTTCPVIADISSEDEYVFLRGNWKKQGDIVPRRFLQVFDGGLQERGQRAEQKNEDSDPTDAVLTSHSSSLTSPSGRYELALQMVDPEQTPIVSRVIVNRIWQHYFGRGIAPTPDDFGHLGQLPTHPELLDWLATELVQHNWSLKHIHRLILSSAAYRMASDERAEEGAAVSALASADPDNLLFHRMNVKRMEGEVIRDAVLAVSGRLDEVMYGKSSPVHLTPFMEGRGRPGESGPVDNHGRRSLYIGVRRNFPDPFLQAFDFPNPHSTIGRRSVSNVPAQALAMMNNPLVVQEAQRWGKRILDELSTATSEERINQMFLEAFSRAPTAAELTGATEFLELQAQGYGCELNDPRPWTDYAHVLLNLKEFVFVR